MAKRKTSGGGGRFAGGLLVGAALVAGGGYLYLHHDIPGTHKKSPTEWQPPLLPSTTAPAAPAPHIAAKRQPPFGPSEDVFEAGAKAYHAQCAQCHGTPGHPATAHKGSPVAAQFWRDSGASILNGKQPGDLYTAIAIGSPKAGMPSYKGKLTETQIWDISLLLKSAGGDIPDPVKAILTKH